MELETKIEELINSSDDCPTKGILCVLLGALKSGMDYELFEYLIPFNNMAIKKLTNTKYQMNN